MIRNFVSALALLASGAAVAAEPAPAPTLDYLNNKFEVERVLDWGDRPVFSPDSKRIVFTVDDWHDTPAYEMDLATRKVRCLTCRFGASGNIRRVYYLNDGSYLLTGPASLETASTTIGAKPGTSSANYVYWMPADASMPPQPLGATVDGEVAIDYDYSPQGTTRIAWGEILEQQRTFVGEVVNDGKRAALVNRTLLYDGKAADPDRPATYTETYDFIDGGKSVLFFSQQRGKPFNGMYKIDIATGKMTQMPTDAQHNETHSFPDVRFGLEESNRGSDPTSPYRGISGHWASSFVRSLKMIGVSDAEAAALAVHYAGKPFDLYVHDWVSDKRRRLTTANDVNGEAHQSTPARDGKHIAYSIRPALNGTFTGKAGIYIGTFSAGK